MKKSVAQKNFGILREVIRWRSERDVAQFNLDKAKGKLEEVKATCEELNVPQPILSLLMEDNTGSGVREILEKNGIEIEPEYLTSTRFKGEQIKLGSFLTKATLAGMRKRNDYHYSVEQIYKNEYGEIFFELLPVLPKTNIPFTGLSDDGVKMEKITCTTRFLENQNLEIVVF